MWGEDSKNCEIDCQCSGLITESFRIHSENSATKRKREEALSHNYRTNINPHALDFTRTLSPLTAPVGTPPKRRVLGELQNSPLFRPTDSPTLERLKKTPAGKSPFIDRSSPLTSRAEGSKRSKISRIFEERSLYRMASQDSQPSGRRRASPTWTIPKIVVTDVEYEAFLKTNRTKRQHLDFYVPENRSEEDTDYDTLHDLDEFDSHDFDECSNFEIISTDSPNVIFGGRSSAIKVAARGFEFGAPLRDTEASTSFNRQPSATATRTLNFEDGDGRPTSTGRAAKKALFTWTQPTPRAHRRSRSRSRSAERDRQDAVLGATSREAAGLTPAQMAIMAELDALADPHPRCVTTAESGFASDPEEGLFNAEDSTSSAEVPNFDRLVRECIKGGFPGLPGARATPPGGKRRLPVRPGAAADGGKRRRSAAPPSPSPPPSSPAPASPAPPSPAPPSPALIGDLSAPHALPLAAGEHGDLRAISGATLAALLRGRYDHVVREYRVIDCRYPYEFEGGHVVGALNVYTAEQASLLLQQPRGRRQVLVFHCEFSQKRGPKLCRYLRALDRSKNTENYPQLHYPEVYLLHEGYRGFFRRYPGLCSPAGYVSMLDPAQRHLMKKYRSIGERSFKAQSKRSS